MKKNRYPEMTLDLLNRPNKNSLPLSLKLRLGAAVLALELPTALGGFVVPSPLHKEASGLVAYEQAPDIDITTPV